MVFALQCAAFAAGILSIPLGFLLMGEGYNTRFNLMTNGKVYWIGFGVVALGLGLIRASFL